LFHDLSTPLYLDGFGPGAGSSSLAEMERELRGERLEALEKIAARLRSAHGLKVTTAVEWDYPVHEAVLRQALRIEAGLIVAQSHARGHRAAVLLSYTDWELLRSSPVPFLLVKSSTLYRHPRVLAAIDPTHAYAKPAELDDEILTLADRIAGGLKGELQAMHAFQLPAPLPLALAAGPIVDVPSPRAETEAAARERFGKALRRYDVRPKSRYLACGLPAEVIPAVARRARSNIVVMGALSRSGLKRLFIGNTAEQVIDRLACDVLVVKAKGFKIRVPRTRRGPLVVAAPLLS
jgi:universal stress protein E